MLSCLLQIRRHKFLVTCWFIFIDGLILMKTNAIYWNTSGVYQFKDKYGYFWNKARKGLEEEAVKLPTLYKRNLRYRKEATCRITCWTSNFYINTLRFKYSNNINKLTTIISIFIFIEAKSRMYEEPPTQILPGECKINLTGYN